MLRPGPGNDTTYIPMHSQGKSGQMHSVSRLIAEMSQGSEHGPRHRDYFSRRTFKHHRRNKRPATMSKYKSTLKHPSHWLSVYIFRLHSYILHTYTTDVFHSHRKQKWESTANGSTAVYSITQDKH